MKKIFVVEDDGSICDELVQILENEGYEAESLESFDNTKDDILKAAPNLVLMDINIPGINGRNLVKEIRKESDVPIIMVTSRTSEMDEVLSMSYGADDYITKPFSSGYLRARISSLLKQRSILREHFMKEVLPVAGKEPVAIQGDALENLSPSVPQITSYDEEFIHKIIQAVEERLQDSDFKIEDLADSMNIGRSVFYKKVKSILGVSPIELVKDMRIKRAIQLLETGNYNISQIAYMSGFSSSQYFSRVFKELKNCTPSEYKIKN